MLRPIWTALSVALFSIHTVLGQVTSVPYDPSPFATIGYITGGTLNNASDVLSGGTLTLNGNIELVIPRNLLVNTPSLTAVAWGEMFTPDGVLNLPLWPEISWEAQVFVNYINGQKIAGIVYVFQEIANINEGFITAIDYEKGEMRIDGTFGDLTTGQRVVINDPVGRYGLVHGDWPLWTADTTTHPAVELDILCPDYNRPVDASGTPLTGFGTARPESLCSLKVGDFIIYSATLVQDANGERLLAAYTIDANLGIFTTPGTIPAYLRIETLQAGINGDPAGEIAQTRVEGYITDETATISIFVIEVDPCTGEQSERLWGSAIPRTTGRKGQWRFRVNGDTAVVVRVSGGTVATPNSILAGQFVSPYPPDGFVFPELLVFGDPQIPHEFQLFEHLVNGYGPWLGGIPGVPQALNPWPGVGTPAIIDCPVIDPLVPVVDAGPDITVVSGQNVLLSGSIANEVDVGNVTFAWTQISGQTVTLAGTDTINATFVAPIVSTLTTVVFSLTASSDAGSTTDSVAITINPSATVDFITLEEVSWKSGRGSGLLTVTATTNSASSALFMSATNPNIDRLAMSPLGGNRFQIVVSVRPAPMSVTVSSSLGASTTTFTIT
ncbi:hypothetical protein BDZ89DRAFT_1067279 [Hymenopellis radicata]|nr:hypothetical protein BDZ89DRAFT_1067279 [Hymenopellis radicata]